MPDATTIFLLRHAESRPTREVPEAAWPLSDRGVRQAEALAPLLAEMGVDAVYSSPYRRALDTVRPFAREHGSTLYVENDLRERKLTGDWRRDFRDAVEQTWADFDAALPGGESCSTCQRRVVRAVTRLVERHRGETLLLSSRGNAIGLLLNHLGASFGFTHWERMKTPDLFRIRHDTAFQSWQRIRLSEEESS